MKRIFIAGGTGFIGQSFIPELIRQGRQVTALARPGSQAKLPPQVTAIEGNALDPKSFQCPGANTVIHLVGAAHPAPWKAAQFHAIDPRSLEASIDAAERAAVRHFIFLSVARPAPIMREYLAIRARCERIIEASRIPAKPAASRRS